MSETGGPSGGLAARPASKRRAAIRDSVRRFLRWSAHSFPPLFGIAWFGSLGVLVSAVWIGPSALPLRHIASTVLMLLIIGWLAVSGTGLLLALRQGRTPRRGSRITLDSIYVVVLHLTAAVFIGGALALLVVLVLSLAG